jgi:hypothetical protein
MICGDVTLGAGGVFASERTSAPVEADPVKATLPCWDMTTETTPVETTAIAPRELPSADTNRPCSGS